jgi:hypothetical protein
MGEYMTKSTMSINMFNPTKKDRYYSLEIWSVTAYPLKESRPEIQQKD